jgi:hypothetical protein
MAGRLLVVAGDRTTNGLERQVRSRPRIAARPIPLHSYAKRAHERAGQQMEKLTFGNVVGFVLAVLFALVIGISMWALLIGDYMNTVMNEQTRHTLRIVGFAGALAALATWWVQSFAAKRGFVVRFMFAFFIFVVAFCSFGGLLRFIYIHATYPNQQDWSLTGMYLASLNDFYTFLLDMLLPPRPAYAALTVAAAIFVAWFGPREARTADI